MSGRNGNRRNKHGPEDLGWTNGAWCRLLRRKDGTWMSQEVSKWLVDGYNLLINWVYWGYKLTVVPTYKTFTNFLGHPRRALPIVFFFKRSMMFSQGRIAHGGCSFFFLVFVLRCFLRIVPWDSAPFCTTIWEHIFGTFSKHPMNVMNFLFRWMEDIFQTQLMKPCSIKTWSFCEGWIICCFMKI